MATKEEMILAVKAVRHGLVTQDKVQECLNIQKGLDSQGKGLGLLEILLRKGYLATRHVVFLKSGDGVGLDLGNEPDRLVIDGYTLDRKIGQGGMATVYQARRLENGLFCAVKILFTHHSKNPKLVEGFLNEGQLLKRLGHENMVRGFEAGESRGYHFMALEFVEGVTVQQILDKMGALSEDLALHIILQVARALRYLASQDITHRDIKPGNMLIDVDGRIKLCDLGFAKPVSSSGGPREETTCGTVQYISPEQATGRRDIDVRSDIYSLGATLYHLVIGEVPFQGSDSMEVMAKQIREGLSCPKVKNRNISRHMHYFLEKMMAKEREIRYESPDELIADIEDTVEGNRSLQFDPTGEGRSDPLEELAAFFRENPLDAALPLARRQVGKSDSRRAALEALERRKSTGRNLREGHAPASGRLAKDPTSRSSKPASGRIPREAAPSGEPPTDPLKNLERRSSRIDRILGRKRRGGA